LMEARQNFKIEPVIEPDELLFSEYMKNWLDIVKPSIELSTYAGYSTITNATIIPYFKKKVIKLNELQSKDIQDFYTEELNRVSASTVLHYHIVIHKALKRASKMGMIPTNPAQNVERPKVNKYVGEYYDGNELKTLFETVKGDRIELPTLFGAYYGLRRSEVVGLKWSAIDFENNTFTIRHTVTDVYLEGKKVTIEKDRAKNKASLRTLPLIPMFKERLLDHKQKQEQYKKLCGKSYSNAYAEYILLNELGQRISPNYITRRFPLVLEMHGLKKIRYHDLRHSCASLLLANGVSMKEIQEWLGHSNFSTTANFYSHLDFSSKVSSAQTIEDALK